LVFSTAITDKLRMFQRNFSYKRSRGQSTGMLLLDVEKAFDSVWHDALRHKLIQAGCNIFLARIIHSFLSGGYFPGQCR
jgi:hypothetical protein